MKRVLLIAAAGLVLLYAGDYASLRYGIPNREPFATVMVQRSYAIPQKNKKVEYDFEPPAPAECVNALFPHFGDPPCWYLKRHPRQEIKVPDS